MNNSSDNHRNQPNSASPAVSARLKANYDDYYDAESHWRALGAIDKVKNIVALCSKYAHSTILDIGSGEGSVLARLSKRGFGEALHSLEISTSGVETITGRRIPSLRDCRLFDGYNIPYEDSRFDLVVLCHVVEHLEHPRKLLCEAARVGRHVFVEVPLEDNFGLRRDYVPDKVGHINHFSSKTIRRLLQTCGLEVLDQKITNPSWPVYKRRWGRKGIPKYLVKGAALLTCSRMATALWTYHCSLISRKADR